MKGGNFHFTSIMITLDILLLLLLLDIYINDSAEIITESDVLLLASNLKTYETITRYDVVKITNWDH